MKHIAALTFTAMLLVPLVATHVTASTAPDTATTLAAGPGADRMAQEFLNPPAANRPAVFGFMMPYGVIPDEVITRDLEEIKAKGISTCLLYSPGGGEPSRSSKLIYGESENQVEKTAEYSGPGAIADDPGTGNVRWSPAWRKTIRAAARTAGRIGLELGVCVGGIGCELQPGIAPEYTEQTLVYSSKAVKGPVKVDEVLPLPSELPLKKDMKNTNA